MFVYALRDHNPASSLHHGRVLINLAHSQALGITHPPNQNGGTPSPWLVIADMGGHCQYALAETQTREAAEQVIQSLFEALKHGKPAMDLAIAVPELAV